MDFWSWILLGWCFVTLSLDFLKTVANIFSLKAGIYQKLNGKVLWWHFSCKKGQKWGALSKVSFKNLCTSNHLSNKNKTLVVTLMNKDKYSLGSFEILFFITIWLKGQVFQTSKQIVTKLITILQLFTPEPSED